MPCCDILVKLQTEVEVVLPGVENRLDPDSWLLGSELVSEVLGLEVPEGEKERLDEDTGLSVHGHHPLLEVGGSDVPLVVLQGVQVEDGVVAGVSLGDGLQVSPLGQLVLSDALVVIPLLPQEVLGISSSLVLSINPRICNFV